MNVVDFGKNTYQSEVMFKVDCISPDFIFRVALSLHNEESGYSLAKEPQTNLAVISKGNGSKESPFFQVKLGPDKVILWAGWHVEYDQWTKWRAATIRHLLAEIDDIPGSFVGQIATQVGMVVPPDRLKKHDDVVELQPVLQFIRRYVPAEYLARSAGTSIFADSSGTRIIETQAGGNIQTGEGIYNYVYRWISVHPQLDLKDNLSAHFDDFETVFGPYNAKFVPLYVKLS